MKTKFKPFILLSILFSIVTLISVLYSCRDEEFSPTNSNNQHLVNKKSKEQLNSAIHWFKENDLNHLSKQALSSKFTNTTFNQEANQGDFYFLSLSGKPSWKFYVVSENDSLITVDVDLTDRVNQDFVTEDNLNSYKSSGELKYRRSYTRFVHTKIKSQVKKTGFI